MATTINRIRTSRWFASERIHGNMYYAFTHDDSTYSIAPKTFGSTKFDLPTMPAGNYDLVSVTNGIPSESIRVSVH